MQRQITVYEAAQNGKVTVLNNVEATTLGELKNVLVAKGINIENMDFMEGVSNIVLRDDNSVLPTNVPYKGSTTNDLFIYLSLKNKKIASGACMSRPDAYLYIKAHELGDAVKEKFGRNYTQVPTAELLSFIEESRTPAKPVETPRKETANPDIEEGDVLSQPKSIKAAFINLLDILYNTEIIDDDQYDEIMSHIQRKNEKESEVEPKSTFADDINNFLNQF